MSFSSATNNANIGGSLPTANTGTSNTSTGVTALSSITSGGSNSAYGTLALGYLTSGSGNTGLGFAAGALIASSSNNATGANSIFIGGNTRAAANGDTNEIVIGSGVYGDGSNTAVIGNSSLTDVYFGSASGLAGIHAATWNGIAASNVLKADGTVTGATSQAQVFTDGVNIGTLTAGTGALLSVFDNGASDVVFQAGADSTRYLGIEYDRTNELVDLQARHTSFGSTYADLHINLAGGAVELGYPSSAANSGGTQEAICLADGTGGCAYLGASTNAFTGALSAYSLTSIAAIVPESGIAAGGYSLPISGNTLLLTAGQTGANSIQFSTTTGGNAFGISGTTSYLLLQAFPTSCSGQPSKTIAAVGWVSGTTPGTLTLCP